MAKPGQTFDPLSNARPVGSDSSAAVRHRIPSLTCSRTSDHHPALTAGLSISLKVFLSCLMRALRLSGLADGRLDLAKPERGKFLSHLLGRVRHRRRIIGGREELAEQVEEAA